jgi:FkbM family methyltransferase
MSINATSPDASNPVRRHWLTRGFVAVFVERRLPHRVQLILDRLAVLVGIPEKTLRIDRLRVRVRRRTVDEIFVQKVLVQADYNPDGRRLNGAIVDIGANIGSFALYASQTADRVIAVEPEAENYRLLTENIRRNALSHVTPIRAAVAAEPGVVQLNCTPQGGFHSIAFVHPTTTSVQSIKAITLPQILDEYGITRCSLLKLDCEGAEHQILLNLPYEYYARIDRIALEYHLSPDEDAANAQLNALLVRLTAAGMSIDRNIRFTGRYAGCGMLYASRSGDAPSAVETERRVG